MSQKNRLQGSRRGEVTKTLSDLLADVHSEMEGLRDELQEWKDNIPENLQEGQKAQELDEAIDQLESVDEVECPEALKKAKVTWWEVTRKRKSRNQRRDDCVLALSAAKTAVEKKEDGQYDALIEEIQTAIDEYEAVDFPGMH